MSLSTGAQLGPYEILAPIGAGGMGEVYRGRDTRLDRMVAIKVSKDKFSERFEREARARSRIESSAHLHALRRGSGLPGDGARRGRAAEGSAQNHVIFLLNFLDELRRRVPAE
jgi:serine/threonine protein kinase